MKKLVMLLIVTSFTLVVLPAAVSANPGFIETVTVDASDINGTDSMTALTSGVNYRFEATGTWQDNSQDNHYIDAEYTTFDGWTTYMDGTTNWGPDQKDLQVNGTFVDWGPYDVGHTYSLSFIGTGSTVNFRVFDGKANLGSGPEEGWYGDNHGTITVEIYEIPTLIEVDVDIKPGSCPNPLNVNSKGVLPVAILGTEDFDVEEIDPGSILLEGVSPLRWSYEDVATPYDETGCEDCTEAGADGYPDLTLKFDTQEVVAALGAVTDGECIELTLTGNLYSGIEFSGGDFVKIIKKGP